MVERPSSYAYQWEDCDATGANCLSIAGATGQTYTPSAADVGYTVRVQEIVSNASGSGVPADSAPTAVVVPLAPSNVTPPAISGSTTDGQTLSESHGSWANNPTSYTYQSGGLRQRGQRLHGDCRRDRAELHPDERGGRTHSPRPGVGEQRRRRQQPASSSATGVVQPAAAPPTKP